MFKASLPASLPCWQELLKEDDHEQLVSHYAFVGTQMTWRLSPFIGKPEDPFYLTRPSRDNFYVDVIHAIRQVFAILPSDTTFVTPILLGVMCIFTFAALIFLFRLFFGKSPSKRIGT